MKSLQDFDWVLDVARDLGYEVRYEWLGGARGGCCEVAGRRLLFVDLSLSSHEQYDQIVESLHADPGLYRLKLTERQREVLKLGLFVRAA